MPKRIRAVRVLIQDIQGDICMAKRAVANAPLALTLAQRLKSSQVRTTDDD
ncbi:MAG: hypothetical protein ACXADH_07700 [Candidatus Kariarchaeaceae archaeon]